MQHAHAILALVGLSLGAGCASVPRDMPVATNIVHLTADSAEELEAALESEEWGSARHADVVTVRLWKEHSGRDHEEVRGRFNTFRSGGRTLRYVPRLHDGGATWEVPYNFLADPVVVAVDDRAEWRAVLLPVASAWRERGLGAFVYRLGGASYDGGALILDSTSYRRVTEDEREALRRAGCVVRDDSASNGSRHVVSTHEEWTRALVEMPSANVDPANWCWFAVEIPLYVLNDSLSHRYAHRLFGYEVLDADMPNGLPGYRLDCVGGELHDLGVLQNGIHEPWTSVLVARFWQEDIPFGIRTTGGHHIYVPEHYRARGEELYAEWYAELPELITRGREREATRERELADE